MKNILITLKKILYGILVSLLTIGIATIITLNSKFIYSYSINKYNLVSIGKVSKDMLMKDYSTLINYLQNPFISKLKFINFPMSLNGEFHFYEVKKIFLCIYIMTIGISLVFLLIFIYKKVNKKIINIYRVLNYGANTLICIIGGIVAVVFVDFSKAFIVFHKIFFNNDYWIFDEKTDPIINVLPEELFKLYALVVVSLVVFFIIVYKVYYYKKNLRRIEKYNKSIKI